MRPFTSFEEESIQFLVRRGIEFATIHITQTGFKKSTLDATIPVRSYFKKRNFVDYDNLARGRENGMDVKTLILTPYEKPFETTTSIYKPKAKQDKGGDPRLWIIKCQKYISPNDIFILIELDKSLYVIDISKVNIQEAYNSVLNNYIREFIDGITMEDDDDEIAIELYNRIKEELKGWKKVIMTNKADTAIGRSVEHYLGINMNSNKEPDYKGIELKTHRIASHNRVTLFSQAPFSFPKYGSSKKFVEKYGYPGRRTGKLTFCQDIRGDRPNKRNFKLDLNYKEKRLEANYCSSKPDDNGNYRILDRIALWQLDHLHNRLLEKHNKTFWIEADRRDNNGIEEFQCKKIIFSKRPLVSQFDTLIENGTIITSWAVERDDNGGDYYNFRIFPRDLSLLIPENEPLYL